MDVSEIGESPEAEGAETGRLTTDELLSQLAAANERIAQLTAEVARLEDRARRGRARYRTLVANLPVVTYTASWSDMDAALWVSSQVEEVLGYSREDFKANSHIWLDGLHPDDRDGVLEAMEHAQETGEPFITEYRFITRDGRTIWLRDHAALVRDETGTAQFWQGVMQDITGAKLAEERLRENEEKYRELVELLPDAVGVVSAEGKVLFLNSAGARLLGAEDPEQLLGMPVMDFVHPDYRESSGQRFRAVAIDRQRIPPAEEVFVRLDGTHVPVEVAATPITYQGEPAVLDVFRDISERTRAENELRESRQRLQTVLEHLPIVLFAVDAEGNITLSEGAGLQVMTLGGKGNVGRNVFGLYADRPDICEPIRRALAGEEFTLVSPTPSGQTFETTFCPLRDEHGNVTGVTGIALDVTERAKAEKALREGERRYRLLAENAADVIWTVDMDMGITFVSPSIERLCGYTAEELIGTSVENLLTPASLERARKWLREDMPEGPTADPAHTRIVEEELRCKDGSTVCVESHTRMLRDDDGRPLGPMGVTRDITERRELEKTISKLESEVRRWIGDDLHDSLGQNLAGISYLAKLLQRNLAEGAAVEAADAGRIVALATEAMSHTRALARGLLPVDLSEHSLMSALEELAADKEEIYAIPCTFRCDQPVQVHNEAVATQLFNIAGAAVNNAVRHARADQITIDLSESDGTITLTVTDDGIGFSEDTQRKGGMGLKITAHRARMIGASLDVQSRPGEGTTVQCIVRNIPAE